MLLLQVPSKLGFKPEEGECIDFLVRVVLLSWEVLLPRRHLAVSANLFSHCLGPGSYLTWPLFPDHSGPGSSFQGVIIPDSVSVVLSLHHPIAGPSHVAGHYAPTSGSTQPYDLNKTLLLF